MLSTWIGTYPSGWIENARGFLRALARSRKIEHRAAIDAAQALFWQDGYSGVSTRQIEEKTGLTRFTQQAAYGGKKALFLQTLDNYLERAVTEFLPRPTANVLEALADWFEDQTKPENMPAATDQGCLLLNTINEFERGDPETDHRIGKYFTDLRRCFSDALETGISLGEVDPNLDVAAKTELLVGAVLGMNMIIRAGIDSDAGRAMSASIGAMMREWRA